MAFMNQEKKALLAPAVKAILKKYGVKGSLAVSNSSSLVLNLKSGPIDFIKNYDETVSKRPGSTRQLMGDSKSLQVNTYWYDEQYSGVAKEFLREVITAMKVGNWNKSQIEVDYFDVGWYVNVNVGRWNKPYVLEN
jgi:hypothetical protein